MKAGVRAIKRDIDVLCRRIADRQCGGAGEQAAADYIERELRRVGLDPVRQELFRFPNWVPGRTGLWVGTKRPARRVPNGPFIYSPSTPRQGVTGPLVYLQGGHEADLAGRNLKGKIGLMVGTLSMQEEETKRRFVRSGLAGLVTVDNRIPYDWVTVSGMAPQWVGGYTLPSVSVPFLTAVELVRRLPLRARLVVQGRHRIDTSQNVIGELVGSRYPGQVIVVSAHHDCVETSVGANDNASGVAFVLAIARLLSRRRTKRTVRFVTYGVEERLSVGAYVHMRLLKRRAQDVVFCLNADGVGAMVGEDVGLVTGPDALARLVEQHYHKHRHPLRLERGANIYSDQFPLNIAGAPSMWVSRPNIMGRYYWTLHNKNDNPDNVSPGAIARTATTLAALVRRVADAPRLPFARRLPPDIAKEVREGARRAYRHPWPVRVQDGLPTLMPAQ